MNIVDIFSFFNENELLELRIKLLDKHVDKFIICEANRTQTGIPKDFILRKTLERLNLLSDKIKIVEVDLSIYDNNQDHWLRENAQRDAAANHIDINDVCIVSDCDEIINPDFINYYISTAQYNPDRILRIPMTLHYYQADFQLYDNFDVPIQWSSAFICLKSHLKNNTLSNIRFHRSGFSDFYTLDNGKIENAGWHFSWMGSVETLITKYKAAADNITATMNATSQDEVIEQIKNYRPVENGIDILGRKNHILKKYDISLLPNLIFELEHIKNFLLPMHTNFEENWFTYPNLYLEMIDKFPSGSRFVEVGVWKGRSAFFMCENIIKSGKDIEFFCVDTWKGSEEHIGNYDLTNLYEKFLNNMKSVESYYFPLKLDSISASKRFKDKSLEFVFIDASHDYENVKQDILAWLPKIRHGGILAGHDYYPDAPNNCGVYRAVQEIFSNKLIRRTEECFVIHL